MELDDGVQGVTKVAREKRYLHNHLGDRELAGASDVWLPILKYGIRTATHFEAHFPDDESDLAEGKDEFRRLPKVSVTPWSGMEGAIAVSGEMTPEARELFTKCAEEQDPWLWSYTLFRDGKELLSVSDHSDRIVSEHFIKEYMQKLFESWFEPIIEPETQQEAGSTDAFLKLLQEEMKTALSDLAKDHSDKKMP